MAGLVNGDPAMPCKKIRKKLPMVITLNRKENVRQEIIGQLVVNL